MGNNVITGKEFNKLHPNNRFYKFTDQYEKHHGKQLNTGLNSDENHFGPTVYDRGICFTDCENMVGLFKHETFNCVNYRKVTIPDDAKVHIDTSTWENGNRYKASKIILSEKQYIWSNNELCKLIVSVCGSLLKNVEYQTEEICKIAVRQHPFSLIYVKNQTEEICKVAVNNLPDVLEYVKEQTEAICKTAMIRGGYMLWCVKNQTDEMCKIAVAQDGFNLRYVNNQTEEICRIALEQNEDAFRYVKNQTPEFRQTVIAKRYGYTKDAILPSSKMY